MDGLLNGYCSGRWTRTFHMPPSYGVPLGPKNLTTNSSSPPRMVTSCLLSISLMTSVSIRLFPADGEDMSRPAAPGDEDDHSDDDGGFEAEGPQQGDLVSSSHTHLAPLFLSCSSFLSQLLRRTRSGRSSSLLSSLLFSVVARSPSPPLPFFLPFLARSL